jgi:hypothetical protein
MERNFYVADPKAIDEAGFRAKADIAAREGSQATIHHHKHGEPCHQFKHDFYYPNEDPTQPTRVVTVLGVGA